MADPWIKVRENLHTDPRVLAIATHLSTAHATAGYVLQATARDLLGVTPAVTRDVLRDVTVAGLLRVWISANRHTVDGTFHHSDITMLDTVSEIPGFGAAMVSVGYAIHDPETKTVTLPNFGEYNAPAKAGKGSKASERQRRYRERKQNAASQEQPKSDANSDVTRDVTLLSISSSNSGTLNELETLKKRVNSLSPAWKKMSHWGHEDEHLLLQALPNLRALDDQDWLILEWFCRQAFSPANGMNAGEELKLTTKRGQFVTDLPSILERSVKHWKQMRCPRLGPKTQTAPKAQETPSPEVLDPKEAGQLFRDLTLVPKP